MQPTNVRAAHNYGDLDPFKFRWLIPLSALQVRLGNTAGNSLALNTLGYVFWGFCNAASSVCLSGASGNRQVWRKTVSAVVFTLRGYRLNTLTDFIHLVCWLLP